MRRQWILGTAGIAILAVAMVIVDGRGAWAHVSAALASEAIRAPAATLVVTSTADSGPGTLRQALWDATSGDTITFDAAVFPPSNPATIALASDLPFITQGNLTIDASNAGVILDGSASSHGNGIDIVSNGNVIKGLQILNSPWHGIRIQSGASNNLIGGTNASPDGVCSGDCNLISGSGHIGVVIHGGGTFSNTVSGNYIGTDVNGLTAISNTNQGIYIGDGASYNLVGGDTAGERNLISGNGEDGVLIEGGGTMSNTVSGNYIGTDVSGVAALGNARAGVSINGASQNVIGGHAEGERNIISGNGRWGALLTGPGATNNVICGNFVGIDVSGSVALSNGEDGIRLDTGAQYNVIGGATEDERNLISGNGYKGVFMDGANHNVVIGNYVGTDSTGMAPIGNGSSGVEIFNGSQYNRVGGTTSGERNVISGNATYGVVLNGEFNGAQENSVVGNYIGTNATGTGPLGNASHGVGIWNGASNNIVGGNMPNERNIIAYNGAQGVGVYGPDSLRNTITHNSIHDNDGMGIDLDEGGNAELAAPAITYFDLVSGVARGTACAGCTVEVFSDSSDEGEVYEGSTTADGSGDWVFDKGAPFAGPHLTATATDADGNTSEFSAPAVPPSISHVVPNQGTNDVPNEINVYGLNFAAGISVTLGTAPPTDLATWRLSSTHLRSTVPAGLPAGTYDLTVTNPDGGSDTLANAYTVFDAHVENDDLYAQSHDLWSDPPTVRLGEQVNLGLIVHRQGGKTTLSNVIVRFYDGDPDGGGALIGDGVIYLLSPRSSASTTRVPWIPAVAGDHAIYARIDPDDTISETIETNNTISTTVTVLPPAGDTTPPVVTSFTINDGAEMTAVPTVTLTVSAEDNVGGSGMGSMFFVELEFAQAAMEWVPVQASGWLSYTTHYTWTLVPVAGVRYMQAWAADRAGNISLYPYKDRINYLLPSDRVAMGQVRLYRSTVTAGQTLTVIVSPISGDPDLYVWPPTEGAPAWVSNNSTGVDQVSIVATASGTYQIEVYGYTAAEYTISINVSGGAASPAAGQQDVQSIHAAKPSRPEPLIPVTNEPLGQMAVPSAPVTGDIHKIYLPLVLKGDLSPAAP